MIRTRGASAAVVGASALLPLVPLPAAAAAVAAIPTTTTTATTPLRFFNASVNTSDELGPMSRMKNITPIVGQPKPCIKEGDWELQFNLTDKMEGVIEKILTDEGWSPAEIKREKEQFNAAKWGTVKPNRDRRQMWTTVEDFQRTPWYRRFRPNEGASVPFVSIEMMKLLEKHLINPSSRSDPYKHLRKRHYEDTFHTEKYSEGFVKNVTRDALKKYTPGMPEYGVQSRKDFLAFEAEYKKRQPDQYMQANETYNAWKTTLRKS